MKNKWRDAQAAAFVTRHGGRRNEDLALRTYTSRLIGAAPGLVLHGGGNTSLKGTWRDRLGNRREALFIKASGQDLATIEPAGHVATDLARLRALAGLEALSDEAMVDELSAAAFDRRAPNPSVEALLHAVLPHKYVDHSHANAVLALTAQPDGEEICRAVFGDRVGIVPYVMSGLGLARACSRVFEENPEIEALILLKHGVFAFGETARQSYGRMIALVTRAEQRLAKGRKRVFASAKPPGKPAAVDEIAPILRGLLAIGTDADEGLHDRFILSFRTSPAILAFVNGADIARYSQSGTVTPDHAIRTKPWPLVLPPARSGKLDDFAAGARAAMAAFEKNYRAYFKRHNPRGKRAKIALDAKPRVLLVPGLGLFGAGDSAKAAAIAGDLAEASVATITAAESIGRFTSIGEADLFDIEYWSLEQAKLGRANEAPLARHICAVTGGAGAIGRATAAAFAGAGAEVVILDLPGRALDDAAGELGALGIACDVTKDASVTDALARISASHGGLDILVSNAGAAWQGRIGEVSDEVLRASFELNFFAHQRLAKAAVAIMLRQGTGGVLLFNASKQAVNPGPNFGPYGLPKAATLSLARQYAVDYGRQGIRSNAVNADRIRSGLLTEEMLAARSKARGVSRKDYLRGNLLGLEVGARDVGEAFLSLALARKTTGAVLTVDGGNIAAALR